MSIASGAIATSAPIASATNGGTFTYTTVVTNNGPAAAAGVTDPTDYPAFMRYALRASTA